MQEPGVREATREHFPFIIASTPPGAWERKLVVIIIALLMLGMAIAIPFAGVQGPRIDAFIPVLQTVMCVADLITACLLFAQYSIQPQRALLVLASGYICSGMFAFLQTLAFPGAYAPAGVFGSTDHAAWFFVLWHTTFPLAVIAYAFLKDTSEVTTEPSRSTGTIIGLTVACVFAAVAALTLLVTAGVGYLPTLYTGGVTQQTLAANIVNVLMWLTGVVALVVLFFRRRSVLDLWLIVTLVAWMPNFIVAALVTTVRFSVGWYMARGYALIASCTVLAVLLTETTFLYARLVNAVTLLRRERANRLMSLDAATAAMAHELRQPLTAIATNSYAAARWLDRSPPDSEQVRASLASISDAKDRAEAVIAGVRELFKKRGDHRTMIHVDDVARQVLRLVEQDLLLNKVSVTTEFQNDLPEVHADRTQIQQVILNLVRNANDAMASTPRARHLRLAATLNGRSSVLLSVQDTGLGIAIENSDRVFEPFFTTKPSGMGLGLAICQTIAQDHGGSLKLAKTDADGCVFELTLPFAATHHGGAGKHA